MGRKRKAYVVKAGKVVEPTAFAVEQPGGTFRVHFWPPRVELPIESAAQLVSRCRDGGRVVVEMLCPAGMVVDLVKDGRRVLWKARPVRKGELTSSASADSPSPVSSSPPRQRQ